MYALVWKSGHDVWREQWYAFTLEVSLQIDFYMIHEDQIFLVDVVVIDLTWEMVTTIIISWPTSVVTKLNAIVKIHKYRISWGMPFYFDGHGGAWQT
jgi:hypothetical protein